MLDEMMQGFSDDDFRRIMLRSLRLMVIVTVVVAPLLWWKMGWQTAALLAIGAAISGSGLWEWLRLMTAVMVRMDGGAKARPMGAGAGGVLPQAGGRDCGPLC